MRFPPEMWTHMYPSAPMGRRGGPSPSDADLEQFLLLGNPEADVEEPRYQLSPQEYIDQVFRQLQQKR
jgi:hypothetical protein